MNIQSMMAQAKKMQKDIEEKQKVINNSEYKGESEWVSVVIKGDHSIKEVKISKTSLDHSDIEVLEDMLLIAVNEANNKLELDTKEKMGQYANLGGLM